MSSTVQADGAPEGWAIYSEHVAKAAAHDAAHRHQEAVDCLALGVRAGDVECMTRLGKRLLVGDLAPCLPREGASFLVDAARAGGAEAPAILSVLSAAGAYVPQSWSDGLSALVVAAERAWQPAQEQLRVLAADRALAASAAAVGTAAPDIWKRLATSIASGPWTQAPRGVVVHADPVVRRFPDLLTGEVCDWLIEQARPRLVRAKVYDSVAGEDITHETRTNTAASYTLVEVGFVHLLVQARMAAACGLPMQNMESPTTLHYDPGEEITNHFDFVDPLTPHYAEELQRNGQRVMTFLAYLNEDYEGGETEFPDLGVRHKGRRGEGLYFVNAHADGQPDTRMVHAGRPPARGDKWIVSQFIRSREFLSAQRTA
ncbi:MAG: 2OG-Fe(II) oxygenase [Gammaproteobacteria bacterium]